MFPSDSDASAAGPTASHGRFGSVTGAPGEGRAGGQGGRAWRAVGWLALVLLGGRWQARGGVSQKQSLPGLRTTGHWRRGPLLPV